MRAAVGLTTLAVALAFVPLGLVLPGTAWVVSVVLAGLTAALGIVGLHQRRSVALVTPLLLTVAWFLVQLAFAPAIRP